MVARESNSETETKESNCRDQNRGSMDRSVRFGDYEGEGGSAEVLRPDAAAERWKTGNILAEL